MNGLGSLIYHILSIYVRTSLDIVKYAIDRYPLIDASMEM